MPAAKAAPPPLLRVGLDGVWVSEDQAALAACRRRLSRRCADRLTGVLEPGLLAVMQDKLDRATWRTYEAGAERRATPQDPGLAPYLIFLFEPAPIRRLVERLTGCPPIRQVTGGIFRTARGAGHYVRWHGDIGTTTRVCALTVNLGRRPVRGGVFQLKREGEDALLAEFPYDRPGDGILFRLDESLRHRATDIEGEADKTIFTCWFHA